MKILESPLLFSQIEQGDIFCHIYISPQIFFYGLQVWVVLATQGHLVGCSFVIILNLHPSLRLCALWSSFSPGTSSYLVVYIFPLIQVSQFLPMRSTPQHDATNDMFHYRDGMCQKLMWMEQIEFSPKSSPILSNESDERIFFLNTTESFKCLTYVFYLGVA